MIIKLICKAMVHLLGMNISYVPINNSLAAANDSQCQKWPNHPMNNPTVMIKKVSYYIMNKK